MEQKFCCLKVADTSGWRSGVLGRSLVALGSSGTDLLGGLSLGGALNNLFLGSALLSTSSLSYNLLLSGGLLGRSLHCFLGSGLLSRRSWLLDSLGDLGWGLSSRLGIA